MLSVFRERVSEVGKFKEKDITDHYLETYKMISEIIEEAEEEFELVEKKRIVMTAIRELRRKRLISRKEEEEMLKKISEQLEDVFEVLRRKGVVYQHIAGTLIQIVELHRNAYVGEAVLSYLKELEEKVEWTSSWEHSKIEKLMDEYNATLSALKKVWKLLDIPCPEVGYKMREYIVFSIEEGKFVKKEEIDWEQTLKALETVTRCLRSWVESFVRWRRNKLEKLIEELEEALIV